MPLPEDENMASYISYMLASDHSDIVVLELKCDSTVDKLTRAKAWDTWMLLP